MSIFPFPITIPTVISILLVTLTYYHFGSCLSPDGLSLLTFKSAVTSDPYNALSTWSDSSTDPCNWVGVICANISGFTSPRVTAITISDKNITGYLPSEIGALVYLRRLDFNGNFLSGGIPERLSNATSLHSINLSHNNFSGELSAALCSIPILQNLDVSRNSIAGTLPLSFRNCIKLERLVLSNNELIGEVPGELWPEMENLVELDLSGNRFSGRIPPEMGSMMLMTGTLNLSHNKLQGEIPMELGKLPAEVIIDLRENHLSGEIPRVGALENQAAEYFLENPGLCGDPLQIRCKSTPSGNMGENPNDKRRKGLSTEWIVLISVLNAIVAAIIGIILIYIYRKGRENLITKPNSAQSKNRSTNYCYLFRTNPPHTDTDTEGAFTTSHSNQIDTETNPDPKLVSLDKDFSLDLDELLRSSAYVMGESKAMGMLYKVVLESGMAVVVRRLGSSGVMVGGKYNKEFVAEVETIGKIKHPNVVRLRAYYSSPDDKLLITDFVPNGNLASALTGRKDLNWTIRVRIAKGMAQGIAYIHECSRRKFVHGDIKPANILLDNDHTPLISNFGLLRLFSIARGSSLTEGVMGGGFLSYMARYNTMDRSNNYRAHEARVLLARPDQKWDVYSFGLVLLEMITGRPPRFIGSSPTLMKSTSTSSSTYQSGELINWVRDGFQIERSLMEMVDVVIIQDHCCLKKDLVSLFHVALACTETDPDLRPKMKDVCNILDNIDVY